MTTKRGDRAAPPPGEGEFDVRAASSEAGKGWDDGVGVVHPGEEGGRLPRSGGATTVLTGIAETIAITAPPGRPVPSCGGLRGGVERISGGRQIR